MKKYFEDPRFSLIRFSACDVIVTSDESEKENDNTETSTEIPDQG